MLRYLRWLIANIKYYRSVKKQLDSHQLSLWENKLPAQIYNKYPPSFNFNGLKVLNIGCGKCTYKTPNVTNLDYTNSDGINVVWDLGKVPLPFEDNTFDLVIANHVLEHIPNWFECAKDLARILKVGGTLEIWVPPVSSDTAFVYRDHINRIGLHSFTDCFNLRQANTNLMADIAHNNESDHWARMEIVWAGYKSIFVWWLLFLPEWFCEWAKRHLRNTVSEEGFKLRKREVTLGRI